MPCRRPALRQPVEEPLPELALVLGDEFPADLAEVLDRGDEARQQLVRQRPRLVAVPDREVVGAGGTLYGRHDSSSSRRPNASPRCGP